MHSLLVSFHRSHSLLMTYLDLNKNFSLSFFTLSYSLFAQLKKSNAFFFHLVKWQIWPPSAGSLHQFISETACELPRAKVVMPCRISKHHAVRLKSTVHMWLHEITLRRLSFHPECSFIFVSLRHSENDFVFTDLNATSNSPQWPELDRLKLKIDTYLR